MGRPKAFAESNQTYVGPAGAGIDDLPVHKTPSTVVCCWELTPLEIQEILKTGVVWVHVLGHTVIPMYVSGHSPFSEVCPPGHTPMEYEDASHPDRPV